MTKYRQKAMEILSDVICDSCGNSNDCKFAEKQGAEYVWRCPDCNEINRLGDDVIREAILADIPL